MGKYIDARNILLSFRTAQQTFLFQILQDSKHYRALKIQFVPQLRRGSTVVEHLRNDA
jgi:hypothetical protein